MGGFERLLARLAVPPGVFLAQVALSRMVVPATREGTYGMCLRYFCALLIASDALREVRYNMPNRNGASIPFAVVYLVGMGLGTFLFSLPYHHFDAQFGLSQTEYLWPIVFIALLLCVVLPTSFLLRLFFGIR